MGTRILILGAGAVGKVYGHYLQAGGAHVGVYVRPKYAQAARAGFVLYPEGQADTVRWTPDSVVTSPEAMAAETWDQVWLCISSAGLRGDWIGPFFAATGTAQVVSMLPGLRDRALLEQHIPPERLTVGLIAFSAWDAPLPGSTRPTPGLAWWHPPMAPNRFEGPAAADTAALLRRGGGPAATGGVTATGARGTPLLLNLVATLECAGWSFATFRSGDWSAQAALAGRQALTISCAQAGVGPWPLSWLLRAFVLRLLTRLAPAITPFDFERFLEVHFSKVGEQTELALEAWIAEGAARGMPTDALERSLAGLRGVRAG